MAYDGVLWVSEETRFFGGYLTETEKKHSVSKILVAECSLKCEIHDC